jgi:hypothetical protein
LNRELKAIEAQLLAHQKTIKRRQYKRLDQFVQDMDQMFNNAKAFNEDGSHLYKDAVRAKTHSMSGVFSPATSLSADLTVSPPSTPRTIMPVGGLDG